MLIEFLTALNALHPLAIIALLVLVLFYVIRNNKTAVASMDTLQSNHLSELPEIKLTLRIIAASLQRIEERQIAAVALMTERLKG